MKAELCLSVSIFSYYSYNLNSVIMSFILTWVCSQQCSFQISQSLLNNCEAKTGVPKLQTVMRFLWWTVAHEYLILEVWVSDDLIRFDYVAFLKSLLWNWAFVSSRDRCFAAQVTLVTFQQKWAGQSKSSSHAPLSCPGCACFFDAQIILFWAMSHLVFRSIELMPAQVCGSVWLFLCHSGH